MPKTIIQKIIFKNTDPENLYAFYMSAKKHSEITGALAKISAKEGAKFTAYDDYITGKNLQLIEDKLIVQSWRGSDWASDDVDSTFILLFEAKGKDTVMYVTHANLPDEHAKSIADGWHEYYWNPWKAFLSKDQSAK